MPTAHTRNRPDPQAGPKRNPTGQIRKNQIVFAETQRSNPGKKEGETMKKILSVVALIAVSASLVACGGEKKEAAPAEAPAVVEEPAPATTETGTTTTTETSPVTTETTTTTTTTEAAPATTTAPPAAPAK
jgi:hypothetical protein